MNNRIIVLESYQTGRKEGLDLSCVHRIKAFHFAQCSQATFSQGCNAAISQSYYFILEFLPP